MMKCGGMGSPNPADADIQRICDSVKGHVESQAGKTYATFTAVSYTSQVVAGMNYFVKIHVGDADHVHARIYQPLPPNHENHTVHSVQQGKSAEDAIEYF